MLADRVEREFVVGTADMDHGKRGFGERRQKMWDVIQGLSSQDRDELVCARLRGAERFQDAKVESVYWEEAVADLMYRERWELVRDVLAARPVFHIGGMPIEFAIASKYGGPRLKVLCDVYARKKSEPIREGVAVCFRRAFPRWGEDICDRVLVQKAAIDVEYLEGRKVNLNYPYLMGTDGSGPPGLFLAEE